MLTAIIIIIILIVTSEHEGVSAGLPCSTSALLPWIRQRVYVKALLLMTLVLRLIKSNLACALAYPKRNTVTVQMSALDVSNIAQPRHSNGITPLDMYIKMERRQSTLNRKENPKFENNSSNCSNTRLQSTIDLEGTFTEIFLGISVQTPPITRHHHSAQTDLCLLV
ncbi:unnamed protein product [Gadus morhua 'NCC']